MKLADLQKSKLDELIKDGAFILRATIKNATCTSIPSSEIMFYDIINGRSTQFFTHLAVGPDHSSHESARVKSLTADTVFSVTNGRKKPSKHLKFGLSVKNVAGSKKLIGMLNRYGYGVSYTTTEELQIELTFTVTSVSKISPPDLVSHSSLTVGIAYDNFNRFVETLSGKNTLLETVDIMYQSVPEETSGAGATTLEDRPSESGDSVTLINVVKE